MKFQVGEICVIVGAKRNPLCPLGPGDIVKITAIAHCGEPGCVLPSYEIEGYWTIHESSLRKLPPDDKQDYLPPETRKLFDGHKVKNPDPQPKTEAA
jgi:hypothetical protein